MLDSGIRLPAGPGPGPAPGPRPAHHRNTPPPEHTTAGGEQESHKGRATKKFFCLYIGIIAPNQKYLQKKLKKIWKFNFLPYLCSRNQTTNTPKGKKKIQTIKLQSNENNQQQHQTGRALY